jgi:hypothetical protein
MEWTSDNGNQHYTTTQGSCQCVVWHHPDGDWAALISRDGHAVDQNWFPALEDAWAWCEARLAELAEVGRCDP